MKLLLVDGTNLVMRYAHAMLREGQADADDEVALPVLRYCEAALRSVAEVVVATHAIVALDSEAETWRKGLYPEYKANRSPGGGSGSWSRRFRDHVDEAGWQTAMTDGFEGDDVIATLAARAGGRSVAILSGDSDLLVMTSLHVSVYGFGSRGEERYPLRHEKWICEKFGISTLYDLPAYKALVGEPGDNLPGVRGIGPVKARDILRRTGNIEDLIVRELLDQTGNYGLATTKAEEFRLALQLVTLRTDVPIRAIAPSSCRVPR